MCEEQEAFCYAAGRLSGWHSEAEHYIANTAQLTHDTYYDLRPVVQAANQDYQASCSAHSLEQ